MRLTNLVLVFIYHLCGVTGQFERMFKQDNVLDQPAGAGKILIQSELKIDVLYKPDDCGKKAIPGDTLLFDYQVEIEGKVVEDSYEKNEEGEQREPMVVKTGRGTVILGLENGVMGMCIGEKRKITIPPHLAFGPKGIPGVVPENAVVIFEVELLYIEPKSWGEWYVDMIWGACYVSFLGGFIVLIVSQVKERRKERRQKRRSYEHLD